MEGRTKRLKLQKLQELDSPFHGPFSFLMSNLSLLEELEKRLTKSVLEMQERQMSEWKRQADQLNAKDVAAFRRMSAILGIALARAKKGRLETRKAQVRFGSPKGPKLLIKLVKAVVYPPRFNDFIRNMSLVYLISAFENFLEQMMEIAFREEPKALVPFQTTITAEELVKCKDLEAAKTELAQKAIAVMMYGDIEEINKRLKQRLGIAMSDVDAWKNFEERFYRRNLIIHKSGEVDEVYRKKVGFRGKTKVLRVSDRYLLQSLDLFRNMALDLFDAFHSKFAGV